MATTTGFTAAKAIRALLPTRPELKPKMQWQQAQAVGVSPAEWSRLQQGARSGLRLSTLIALCRGFGVDLPTFLRLGGMPEAEVQALLPYLRAGSPLNHKPKANNLTITNPDPVTYPKKTAKNGKTVKATKQILCEPPEQKMRLNLREETRVSSEEMDELFAKDSYYTLADGLYREGGLYEPKTRPRELRQGGAPGPIQGRRKALVAPAA